MIAQGGESLAKLVSGLRQRGVATALVVASGGVITSQPDLAEAFRAALAELAPTFELHILEVPPVTGAVALARAVLCSAAPSVAPVSSVESA